MIMTTEKQSYAESEFDTGLDLLEKTDYEGAKECFKNAHEGDRENPKYLSYYGLSMAYSDGNPLVGIELCNRAIKMEPENPEFYLNLGKIHAKIKDRQNAMAVFREGLEFDPKNKELINELNKIGQRKSSAVPLLSRNNIANVYLGKLKSFLEKL